MATLFTNRIIQYTQVKKETKEKIPFTSLDLQSLHGSQKVHVHESIWT